MSAIRENAVLFPCEDEELVGVVSRPDHGAASVGVLIVVGGPQYRVGSHRQFVLLARALARNGIACMRFDYRGMGDATGDMRTFEAVSKDMAAAVDAFCQCVPEMEGIVLWGLCDGASAACFFAPTDSRIKGLVLLNPWVRTEQGEAKTYLKHYYLRRVFSLAFWLKLLKGGVSLGRSVAEVTAAVNKARSSGEKGVAGLAAGNLPDRMLAGLQQARQPMLVILSGRDYVAREFEQVCRERGDWTACLKSATVQRLPDADHTFSSANDRNHVANLTIDWLQAQLGVKAGH